MKKLFFIALTLVSLSASAQNGFRLNGYANYVFDDQVDSYYGNGSSYFDGKIKGGFQWGVGAEFMVSPFNAVELTYYNQATTANAKYASPGGSDPNGKFDVGLNWIMLNGVRHIAKPGGKFEGSAGLGLGVCIINTTNTKTNADANATKFAWQFRGGGTVWATEKIGIKLNVQLQSAVQSVGGGFSIGTGGAGVGVASYSSLLQFGLGGGLSFKLGGSTGTKPAVGPRPSM
jgi:hypothetical protein